MSATKFIPKKGILTLCNKNNHMLLFGDLNIHLLNNLILDFINSY